MNPQLAKLQANITNRLKNLKLMMNAFITKLGNYEDNNYQLGMDSLARGNLRDAQFRFWLLNLINPKHPDAAKKLAEVNKLLAAQKKKP